MARKRNRRKKTARRKEIRPVRALFTLFAVLGLVFVGLAQFASPAPDTDGALDASDLTRNLPPSHVGHRLPNMDRMKIDDTLFGGSSLRTHATRMRASRAEPRFAMGGLRIGMTYGEFLDLGADVISVKSTKSGVLGVVHADHHRFNVYFPSNADDAPADRLSYHRIFRDRSEREITEYLGDLWGKPSDASCRRLIFDAGQDCVYSWWPMNGVKLTAQVSRTEDGASTHGKVTLRIDALNPQAENRRMRQVRLAANMQ